MRRLNTWLYMNVPTINIFLSRYAEPLMFIIAGILHG